MNELAPKLIVGNRRKYDLPLLVRIFQGALQPQSERAILLGMAQHPQNAGVEEQPHARLLPAAQPTVPELFLEDGPEPFVVAAIVVEPALDKLCGLLAGIVSLRRAALVPGLG